MGLPTRRHVGFAGLMLMLVACGQTAEAPAATDLPATTPATDATAPATTPTTTSPPSTSPPTPPESTVNDESDPPIGLQPATTKPQPEITPTAGTGDIQLGSIDPALLSLAALATTDLATRLGVDESNIEVVTAEVVTWPDSSLGCPQPGMAYLQVPVDGFRILLERGDAVYSYHAGGSTYEPFLCEEPDTRVIGLPLPDVDD